MIESPCTQVMLCNLAPQIIPDWGMKMPIARQKIEVGLGFPGLGSEEDHKVEKKSECLYEGRNEE